MLSTFATGVAVSKIGYDVEYNTLSQMSNFKKRIAGEYAWREAQKFGPYGLLIGYFAGLFPRGFLISGPIIMCATVSTIWRMISCDNKVEKPESLPIKKVEPPPTKSELEQTVDAEESFVRKLRCFFENCL